MIVVIRKDTQEPAMRQLAVRLMNQGVRIGRTPGQDADVLTLVGDTWRLDPEGLLALPYVLDVRRITPPYRLAGRAAHPENTVVEVGSARIGAEFCLIAGPCAVESQVQMAGVARRVKAAGAQLLRGGVFKPRTSPLLLPGAGSGGHPPAGGRRSGGGPACGDGDHRPPAAGRPGRRGRPAGGHPEYAEFSPAPGPGPGAEAGAAETGHVRHRDGAFAGGGVHSGRGQFPGHSV